MLALIIALTFSVASAEWAIFAQHGAASQCTANSPSYFALEYNECHVILGLEARMTDGTTYNYYDGSDCEEEAAYSAEDINDCFEFEESQYAVAVATGLSRPVNQNFPFATIDYLGLGCDSSDMLADVRVYDADSAEV
mmetsp:Transcript_17765/g.15553  ORF Transcript_17765/g.15553 Transcript_17765/m.15553 type:complete len:138 (-) Transcript_17765:329-742(-)